ncbi:nucleotide pyrophosphatase, partial [Candidatus Micrarchaeota archaeon]|nr:nucleotide pyrophosphatase [Candidatus Micrarchaeota archaeon]
MKKVIVIGLDCADPRLVFDRYLDSLPNIKKMLDNSYYGKMRTCFPAITIPAWMVMASGREPGSLGVYGFRQRDGTDYDSMKISTSGLMRGPKIWEMIDGKSILVGLPPTYPPPKINGNVISCFITPGVESEFTYPPELKSEINGVLDGKEYLFDVVFRTESREEVLENLYKMAERRFKVIEYLMKTKPWQLFWFVEIGVDRIHHAFWKYADPEHPKYEPGNKYENVIREYYSYMDKKIGGLLKLVGEDTYILIVSDHGAKPMKGAFAINDWLVDKGYLKLKKGAEIKAGDKLNPSKVDWGETKAWAWGGYYSRIFINVEGREPEGVVRPSEYENERK